MRFRGFRPDRRRTVRLARRFGRKPRAPIRSLAWVDLSKRSFVATATAVIGLLVDGARMPVYVVTQAQEMASMAVDRAGHDRSHSRNGAGSRMLSQIPEVWSRRVLAVVLASFLEALMLIRGFES